MQYTPSVIRINLTTKELEVSGSEEFVRNFDRQQLMRLVEVLQNLPQQAVANPTTYQVGNATMPEEKDEVDAEYLRKFMDGYNNSFGKKPIGNEALKDAVVLQAAPQSIALYASLPQDTTLLDKALAVAYEVQTTSAFHCFDKMTLRVALRKKTALRKFPLDHFFEHFIPLHYLETIDEDNYRLTPDAITYITTQIMSK